VPAVSARLDKFTWIPDAHYRAGFFATVRHRAVGWQVPQPWVTDADGATVRLDDVLGGRWAILHVGPPPNGAHSWTASGVPTIQAVEPTLVRWLQQKKAVVAVLRPDGFIYAATGSDQTLPPPPTGYVFSTASRTEANA
jgi:3-(3-hydroxy-phenyl)propionate hydroxylase